jgi:hypothetical protein
VKDVLVAVAVDVQLERLQLDTALIGHVAEGDRGEVREAGERAETGELRAGERDLVVAVARPVLEALQTRVLNLFLSISH